MTKILITGGAGFIGSHLAESLLADHNEVVILDNLSYGKREWIPDGAQFIEGDICDLSVCQYAMENVHYVFHCAAMSRAAPSMDKMDLCTQVNIIGTQNILKAAYNAKVKKIIYSGSSTYYGNQRAPQHEYETPADFLNVYALTKSVGEQYCLMFDRCFDLPCVILRYFSVYGLRQPEEGLYALVLGIFLRHKKNNEPLIIHGEGKQKRDFIHVNDVVLANIAALKNPVRHAIFNIGSGENISIKELADMISSEHIVQDRRLYDSDETLADIHLANEILQWNPKIKLKDYIKEIIEGRMHA